MQLHLARDSVAAGDDVDAPHFRVETIEQTIQSPAELQAALDHIADRYLPHVAGWATWAVYSRLPVAIISNRWNVFSLRRQTRPLWYSDNDLKRFDVRDGAIHLYFVYLLSQNPNLAFDVIDRSRHAFDL
jgi:hypothetical protein